MGSAGTLEGAIIIVTFQADQLLFICRNFRTKHSKIKFCTQRLGRNYF